MTRGLLIGSVVCHETMTSVEASLPNCRCSPPTGCAPLCVGWLHSWGPWPGEPSSANPPAPRPAPTTVVAALVVSSVRRLIPDAGVSPPVGRGPSTMLLSYLLGRREPLVDWLRADERQPANT